MRIIRCCSSQTIQPCGRKRISSLFESLFWQIGRRYCRKSYGRKIAGIALPELQKINPVPLSGASAGWLRAERHRKY